MTAHKGFKYAQHQTQSLQDRVSDLETLLDACKSANQQAQDRVKELENENQRLNKLLEYGEAEQFKMYDRIKELEGHLDDAVTGLEWMIENEPMVISKADYEKLEDWKKALNQNNER